MKLTRILKPSLIKQYFQYLRAKGVNESSIKRKQAAMAKFTAFAQDTYGINKATIKKASSPATRLLKNLLLIKEKMYPNFFTWYLPLLLLTLLGTAMGIAVYRQFFSNANSPLAYPSTLTAPPRILSFQGRLTDDSDNPIITATDFIFRLYTVETDGSPVWTSNTCAITPDQDGIFSTRLGATSGSNACGPVISEDIFTSNNGVWLEVQVNAEVLDNRQPIASSAYALNSETLQGFPPASPATASTIPIIDSSGDLLIGASNPDIVSSSGTFTLTGEILSLTSSGTDVGEGGITLQAADTSDASITLNPDGAGVVDMIFEGTAPDTGYGGFVNATNASLTSGSLYYGEVASNATGYNMLEFQAGETPSEKLVFQIAAGLEGRLGINNASPSQALDVSGNATASGNLTVGGQIQTGRFASAPTAVGEGALYYNPTDNNIYMYNGSQWVDLTDTGSTLSESEVEGYIYDSDNTLAGAWSVAFGNNSGTFDLTGSGDFVISDNSTPFATFADDGTFTLDNIKLDGNTIAATNDSGLALYDNASNGIFIKDGGNVGIGTTNPGSKLTVFGDNSDLMITSPTTNPSDRLNIIFNESGGMNDSTGQGLSYNGSGSGDNNYISVRNFDDSIDLVTFTKGGDIGIGTTSPSNIFHIERDSNDIYALMRSTSLNVDAFLGSIWNNPSSNANFTSGNHVFYGSGTNHPIAFRTNNAERMTLTATGNLGIGDLTPDALLEISASSGAVDLLMLSTNDDNNGDKFIVKNSGNVGIGTTSPSYKLEVAGNASASGNLMAGGQVQVGRFVSDPTTIGNGAIYFNETDGNLYVYDGVGWVDLTNQGVTLNESEVEAYIYDNDNTLAGAWSVAFGDNTGTFDLTGTGDFVISDNSTPFATFDADGFLTVDNIKLDGNTISSLSASALTLDSASGTVTIAAADALSNGTWSIASNGTLTGTTWNGNVIGTGYGGLGANVTAAGGGEILYSTSTTAYDSLAAGSSGQILTSGATSAPSWSNIASLLTAGDDIDISGTTNATIALEDDIDVSAIRASSSSGLGIYDDGSNLGVFIEDGGNVGIGTTDPRTKLEVDGYIYASRLADKDGTSWYIDPALAEAGAVGAAIYGRVGIGTSNPQAGLEILKDSVDLIKASNSSGSASFIVNSDGNVGIGTTGPVQKLDVNGGTRVFGDWSVVNGAAGLYLGYDGSGKIMAVDPGNVGKQLDIYGYPIRFLSSQTAGELVRIDADGNVGIGTTSPGEKLHIVGDLKISSDSDVSNSLGSGGLYVLNTGGTTGLHIDFNEIETVGDNLYLQNDDAQDLSVGAGDLFVETTSGSVGINTVNPDGNLHIGDGDSDINVFLSGNTSVGESGLRMHYNDTLDIGVLDIVGDVTGQTPQFRIRGSDLGGTGSAYNFFTADLDTGNVGIGTTAPIVQLDISGAGMFTSESITLTDARTGSIFMDTNDAGLMGRFTYQASPYYRELIKANSSNQIEIGNSGTAVIDGIVLNAGSSSAVNGNIYLRTSNTDRLTVLKSGRVGIGTTNPIGPLTVMADQTGSRGEHITVQGLSNSNLKGYFGIDTDNSPPFLAINFVEEAVAWRNIILANGGGNVGVGTTNPRTKLEVARSTSGMVGTLNTDPTIDIIGNHITARTTSTVQEVLRLHQPNTYINSKGSTFGIGLSFWEDSGSNYPRTRVDFRTTGRTTDDSDTATTVMSLRDDGNVGIGTTSPGDQLHVVGNVRMDSGAANNIRFANNAGNTGGLVWGATNYSNYYSRIYDDGNLYLSSDDIIIFSDITTTTGAKSTEWMRIADGNVGIGDSTPEGKLTITGGNSSSTTPQLVLNGGTSGTVGDLYILDSKNSSSGIGYAAKAMGVNIQNQVNSSNQVVQRTTSGGITGAAAIYLGADDANQGGFGVLTSPQGSDAGTVLTERLTVRGNGNVGIGTTSPGATLEVNGDFWTKNIYAGTSVYVIAGTGKQIRLHHNGTDSYVDFHTGRVVWRDDGSTTRYIFNENGNAQADTSWTTFSPYLSYNYTETGKTKNDYSLGDIVSLKESERWTVTQATDTSRKSVYGVVVRPEGFISIPKEMKDEIKNGGEGEYEGTNTGRDIESFENVIPIAHLGEASTKAMLVPGKNIKNGSQITTSPIKGFATLAEDAGTTLGKALESTQNWNEVNCPPVSSLRAINWPEDDGTNPTKPCFRVPVSSFDNAVKDKLIAEYDLSLSDYIYVGKLMTFVNVSWYSPDIYLTDTGDIKINGIDENSYIVEKDGSVIDKIDLFSKLFAGEIKSGLVEATKIISDTLIATNIISEEKVISPIIETNEIAISDSETDKLEIKNISKETVIEIADDGTTTHFGDLIVKNDLGEEVAKVDTQGNAEFDGKVTALEMETENLVAQEATFSTVYADNIIADGGSFKDLMAEKIAAVRAELERIVSTGTATSSGDTVTGTSLYAQAQDWPINPDGSLTAQSLDNIEDLGITGRLSSNEAFIYESLIVDNLVLTKQSLSSLDGILMLQPQGVGKIDLLAGTMIIEDNGNVTINGNLTVTGSLAANEYRGINGNFNVNLTSNNQEAESGFGMLNVYGQDGQLVASVDQTGNADFAGDLTASGSASFAKLNIESENIAPVIAADSGFGELATTSAQINTNASAGSGSIMAGHLQVEILTDKVNSESLIYVTPTSDTLNQVLFIKQKGEGQFTVGIRQTVGEEIEFNWWVIN